MSIRLTIYHSLRHIYQDKSYSNIEVNHTIISENINGPDKALYTNVIYGVLQNDIYLDYCVRKYCEDRKLTMGVLVLLKMSYYQMYFMQRVPSYAIINDAVEIAKNELGIGVSKFVNAILRKMATNKIEVLESDFKDSKDYYATLYSIPSWLYKMIAKHYGDEVAFNLAKSSKLPPLIYCRVNSLKTSKEEVLKNSYFKDSDDKDCVIYTSSSIGGTSEFKKGYITVQDISAIKVARLLDPSENELVLDMCAAPGSKTTHLAALMNNTGHIIANDIYPNRVELIKDSLKRLGVENCECICEDGLKLATIYSKEHFDDILLDAPCSGFGVIRRKPDIAISSKQEDLDGLLTLQKDLLEVAYKLLKKQGKLVYSTCTVNKKENQNQIKELLNRHSDMQLISEEQIFPSKTSGDGFYMAKLIKR